MSVPKVGFCQVQSLVLPSIASHRIASHRSLSCSLPYAYAYEYEHEQEYDGAPRTAASARPAPSHFLPRLDADVASPLLASWQRCDSFFAPTPHHTAPHCRTGSELHSDRARLSPGLFSERRAFLAGGCAPQLVSFALARYSALRTGLGGALALEQIQCVHVTLAETLASRSGHADTIWR